jgi:methyl-accepting chemotaxis protein
MTQKIFISTTPLIAVVFFVCVYVYRSSHEVDTEASKAIQMRELIDESELRMVLMSEALRGYLLKPDNKEELERKKAADDEFTAAAAKLSKLISDDPEALAASKTMADYDASTLNNIEDEVGKLIDQKSPKAIDVYNSKYSPAREIQNGNFSKLKKIIEVKSKSILAKIEEKKGVRGLEIIALLCLALVIGLGGILYIAIRNINSALEIFKKLDLISNSVNDGANGITQTSVNLSSSSNQQATAITETATAIEQISIMIKKGSDHAIRTQRISEESREVSLRGRSSIDELKGAMGDISRSQESIISQVQSGNQEISKVSQLIQDIANKTQIINDIVFQTKLLSFNASVEAARAGESGKGFAVVAEEVGKLAAMSGVAAQEISDKLQESTEQVSTIVRNNNSRVEALIREGRSRLEQGDQVSTRCSEIFTEISKKAEESHSRLSELAMAATEQSKGITEINHAVNQLNQATNENARLANVSETEAVELKNISDSLRASMSDLRGIFLG